jgi:hypothetical protein
LLDQYAAKRPQKIWYPKPTSAGPGHALAAHASLGFSPSVTAPQLKEWVESARQSRCETLIVSAEALSAAYPDKVGMLAAQTQGCDVQLVFTLTPISRRSMSLWQGRVKHRFDRPLDDAGDAVLNAPGLAADLVNVFADAFPEANISVIIVDRHSPTDLYRHFAAATAIPLSLPKQDSKLVANQSLGQIEAEIVRNFNLSATALGFSEEAYQAGVKILRETLTSDAWRAVVPNVPLSMPEEWVETLAERCVATLENLRKMADEGRIEIIGDVEILNDIEKVRNPKRI